MEGRYTTLELVERLQRLGFSVDAKQLSKAVSDGYLPGPEMEPRGPTQGIGRKWTRLAFRRSVYLSRLRKRGAKGELLKVLMFLRDGWGWDGVKPICQTALTKAAAVNWGHLNHRMRKQRTPADIDAFHIEALADDLGVHDESLVAFAAGVGAFGETLQEGSIVGLLQRLREDGHFDVGDGSWDAIISTALANSGLTLDAMPDAITTTHDEIAQLAREGARRLFRELRRAARSRSGNHEPSNPLTGFGKSQAQLMRALRAAPGRFTPAQFLALFIAVPAAGSTVALEHLRRSKWRFLLDAVLPTPAS